MKRLPLRIGGVDFSTYVNKYGVSFSYEPRMGNNGGMMLDGSEMTDILAWKAVLSLSCNSLTEAEMSALLSACVKEYVEVTFWDPKEAKERTAYFMPSLGVGSVALLEPNAPSWFDGLTITLRER